MYVYGKELSKSGLNRAKDGLLTAFKHNLAVLDAKDTVEPSTSEWLLHRLGTELLIKDDKYYIVVEESKCASPHLYKGAYGEWSCRIMLTIWLAGIHYDHENMDWIEV